MRNINVTELAEIDYPAHPEEPMAESQIHFDYITLLVDNLRLLFHDRKHEVAVLGDISWYPVKNNNSIWTAPDVMVCFGVPQNRPEGRESYIQHRENGVAPSVVFEMHSRSNTQEDIESKRVWYEKYGVKEFYWLFPETVNVRVFIRKNKRLLEQEVGTEWTSPMLGIRIDCSGEELQLFNPDNTLMKPTRDYYFIQRELAEKEKKRAEKEKKRAEKERKRAEKERKRAEKEKARAEKEAEAKRLAEQRAKEEAEAKRLAEQRAEEEKKRAEEEKVRAEKEAEAKRLAEQRAEQLAQFLRQMGIDPDQLPEP